MFKRVGTRVYAANGALVRRFEYDGHPMVGDEWMADLRQRMKKTRRFTAALNGVGPKHEWAKREAGI